MKPIKLNGMNAIYAENQPEYLPLPVFKKTNLEGEVVSCWQLNLREILGIFLTRKIYFSVWTFNKPLQPQRPFVFRRRLLEGKGGQDAE